MIRRVCLFAFLVCLSACAIAPRLTDAEIDPGPYPENYEAIIRQYLSEALFDPDSLKDFSIDAPPKKIYLDSSIPKFDLRRGQGVYECKYVSYNAKNRMGGYTGKSPHIYYIRNGEVVAVW